MVSVKDQLSTYLQNVFGVMHIVPWGCHEMDSWLSFDVFSSIRYNRKKMDQARFISMQPSPSCMFWFTPR